MTAPIRFLSGRQQQQKIGIEGSTEEQKVLEVVGRVGIGTTIFDPAVELEVRGDSIITGILTVGNISIGSGGIGNISVESLNVSGVSTFIGPITGTISTATKLQTPRTFEIIGDVVASPISFDGTGNVSLAATIQPNSVGLGTDTFGDYVKDIFGTTNQIDVTGGTGEGSSPVVSFASNPIIGGNVTIGNNLQVNSDLNVTGNITVGGTSVILNAEELRVEDKNIVLGFTTTQSPNDITANSGGVAIASTVGSPLVSFAGINTLPTTYKQIMWVNTGTGGIGTDAWLFNYGVGIGSTQFPSGTRLSVGSVQFTENDLEVVRNINASGIASFGNNVFVGSGITMYASTGIISATAYYGSGGNLEDLIKEKLEGITARFIDSVGVVTSLGNDLKVTYLNIDNSNATVGYITAVGFGSTATYYFNDVTAVGLTTDANINTSGIITASTLNITGISTFGGTVRANQGLIVSGVLTASTISGPLDIQNGLRVSSGITTLGNVSAGVITASLFSGDGGGLTGLAGVAAGVTVSDNDVTVGTVSVLNFGPSIDVSPASSGIVTFSLNPNQSLGIVTSTRIQSTNANFTNINVGLATISELVGISTLGIGTIFEIKTDNINNGRFYVESNLGEIFIITNDLVNGSLFTVNDSFGVPLLDITGDEVQLLPYGASKFVGIGITNPSQKLDVFGNTHISGNLGIGTTTPQYKLDINGGLRASGVSTFGNDVYVEGSLYVTNDLIFDSFVANNFVVTGIATASQFIGNLTGNINSTGVNTATSISGINLSYSGISTFANGPVLIGNVSTTGTASQPLQVTGGAYVSGNLGIGTTNSQQKLSVVGNGLFSGIVTATQFSTGVIGSAINITSNTISGPEEIIIDPSTVGDNTGILRVKGDLYIDGTQTFINSTSIEFSDFNVGIATTVGTNSLLDGAGIGIGSTSIRKTLTWNNSSTSLKSSENFDLASGKSYKINETEVLSSTTLGSAIVNSSLTSLGTLDQLKVAGISTFTNGPVLIGSEILTGTASQPLQVTGGAYFNGNIGIGTTNPLSQLHVGNGSSGGNPTYRGNIIIESLQTNNATNGLEFKSSNSGNGYGWRQSTVYDNSTDIDFYFQYRSNNASWTSTPVVIKGVNGNVGIGTSSPDALLTVNGVGAFGVGSAAAPSIAITGDLNTGIYSPGADQLAVATNGVGRLFVDASGSVKAGNPSSTRLEVVAGANGVGDNVHSYANNYYIWGLRNEINNLAIESAFGGNIIFRAKNDGVVSSPGTATERARIDSAGNFGIGTTSATIYGMKLAVVNTVGLIPSTQNTVGSSVFIKSQLGSSGGEEFIKNEITSFANGANYGTAITFGTRGTTASLERARIDSSGRLLVGTSTSRSLGDERLVQIEGTSPTTTNISIVRNSNDISAPVLVLGKSRGTSNGSVTIVNSDDVIGAISFYGADGATLNTLAAQILCSVDGTPGANDMPGRLVFTTAADGAGTPTERARIDSNGNVLINTTTATGTANQKLQVTGGASFTGVGASVGIGTTNPQANLHVYGTSTVSSQIIEAQNSASYAAFEVKSGIGTTAVSGLLYSSSNEGNVILRNNSNTTGVLGLCGTQSGGADLVIFRETRNVVIGNNPSIASQTGTANQKLQVQSGAYVSGSVGIGTTNPQYKLHVVGDFGATTKSFAIPHPTKEGMTLRYGSLESPYHGIRLTGSSTIRGGSCVVNLPEYIHNLVEEDGVNINITNIKHGKVIWVEEINVSENNFVVMTEENTGEYEFYWDFTGIRKDVDKLVVEF